jgi:hypothetical protein
MKPIKNGTGITMRMINRYSIKEDGEESLKAHLKGMSEADNMFEYIIRNSDRWARAVLEEAGGEVDEKGNMRQLEDDSIQDFARRIAWHADVVRDCIRRGDAAGAARFGVELGDVIRAAQMKFRWEDTALRGEKVKGGAVAGHEAVHGTRAEKQKRWDSYQDHVDAKHAENAHRSYEDITKSAAEHFGVNHKTIKRNTTRWE